jgi:hypothetical protein
MVCALCDGGVHSKVRTFEFHAHFAPTIFSVMSDREETEDPTENGRGQVQEKFHDGSEAFERCADPSHGGPSLTLV